METDLRNAGTLIALVHVLITTIPLGQSWRTTTTHKLLAFSSTSPSFACQYLGVIALSLQKTTDNSNKLTNWNRLYAISIQRKSAFAK